MTVTKASFSRWVGRVVLAGSVAVGGAVAVSPACTAAGAPDQTAESWSAPRCTRLDARDPNAERPSGGDWTCGSTAPISPGSAAWVELQLTYFSPRLGADSPPHAADAARAFNIVSLSFVPQSGDIPPGAAPYLRAVAHPEAGWLPLLPPQPGAPDVYRANVDISQLNERSAGGFAIDVITPQGKTLWSWRIPSGSYQALARLAVARQRAAGAAIKVDFKAFPAKLTAPLKKIDGPDPIYPPGTELVAHEAKVVSQCQLQSTGRLSACTNLAVVGDLAFGASTLAFLSAVQYSAPAENGPYPQTHIFEFTFSLR